MLKIWLESATYIEPKPGQSIVLELDNDGADQMGVNRGSVDFDDGPMFIVHLHPADRAALESEGDMTVSQRTNELVEEIERGKRLLRARRLDYVSANGAVDPPSVQTQPIFKDVKLFDREALEGVLECITEMQGLVHEHVPYNVGIRVAEQAKEAEQLIYQIVGAEIDGACADCGEPVWSDDLHASMDDEGETSCGSCMVQRFVEGDGSPKPAGLDALVPTHGMDDEASAGA